MYAVFSLLIYWSINKEKDSLSVSPGCSSLLRKQVCLKMLSKLGVSCFMYRVIVWFLTTCAPIFRTSSNTTRDKYG